MHVRVRHGIDDLANDLARLPVKATTDMREVVRDATRHGNTIAKDSAKRSSGAHGKHYPNSFTWETSTFAGFGSRLFQGEYGPTIGRPQGGMGEGFEHGSRNQRRPHHDLAKSADIIGGTMARELRDKIDGWFW